LDHWRQRDEGLWRVAQSDGPVRDKLADALEKRCNAARLVMRSADRQAQPSATAARFASRSAPDAFTVRNLAHSILGFFDARFSGSVVGRVEQNGGWRG
jgi:hypothetical protein